MKQKIAVLGLGISGKSAASFLLKQGHAVVGLDKNGSSLDMHALCEQGLTLGPDSEEYLEGVSQVILSPGIPWSHPVVVRAKKMGIEVIGEIEMAFRHITNFCIGITGSNGKTTTTLLISHVLNRMGISARALGNVGVGLSSYLLDPNPKEVLVVELSSFQLEALKARCLDFACILNITENHLDRYASMHEYAMAKIAIQNCLKEGGQLFVPASLAEQYGDLCPHAKRIEESLNLESNYLAAFTVLQQFGIGVEFFLSSLNSFQRPPHRIEKVEEMDGIVYYNDSKASSVVSVIYAIDKIDRPVVLIVGGTDKGLCYTPWIECFKRKVKSIVAYGQARDKIEKELCNVFPLTKVPLFEEAVMYACRCAEQGDAVLLSPGCSSYDQFRNFEHRGDVFKQLVRTWIEKKQS